MIPYKTYVYGLNIEFDNTDKPEVIPLDIEYIVLVTDRIGTAESFPDIGETFPFRFSGLGEPVFQCGLGFRMVLIISDFSKIDTNSPPPRRAWRLRQK